MVDGGVTPGPLANRRDSIILWCVYTLLAFTALFTTEKGGRLRNWVHKLLFSIEYPQQPLALR